jgi:hypothetical protein
MVKNKELYTCYSNKEKIEYYDRINWGSVLFDLGVLALTGYTQNYWYLLLFLFFQTPYKIPKYNYK